MNGRNSIVAVELMAAGCEIDGGDYLLVLIMPNRSGCAIRLST